MEGFYFLSICCALLFFFSDISTAADIIIQSQSISDDQSLVSQGGSFELGFFSPGISKNRYLGIWYTKVPVKTVVWVANRDNPLTNSSGVLKLDRKGNLVLVNQRESVLWSSNSSRTAENPVVQLLESGNLVLRDEKDGNSENYMWQSFDYPSDTLLPGMKLGWDLKNGLNRRLTSWKNADNPSPGGFTYGIENEGYPEAVMRKGNDKRYRSGPWNGLRYSGAPELKPNSIFKFNFTSNGDEVYYTYQLNDKSVLSRLVLNGNTDGVLQRSTWIDQSHDWQLLVSVPRDHCDMYGLCGAYGSCDLDDAPVCQCLKGFKPRSIQAWNSTNWSGGCVHKVPLDCKGDGFVMYGELKLPDTTHAWSNKSMSLKECQAECLKKCSCMAFTNSDIRGQGSGCVLWFGDLVDIRRISGAGQDLYIRMAASELEVKDESRKKKRVILTVGVAVVLVMLLMGLCGGWCIWKTKTRPKDDRPTMSTVVLMLGSESVVLPTPQQPGFFTERCHMKPNTGETSSNQESCVSNDITVTLLQGDLPDLLSDEQSLVSQGGSFELGFFSPGSSKNRHLGIWYKKITVRTIVWVANRDNPLTNSSGVLKMDTKGNLVLINQRGSVLWSSNSSIVAENPVVQLLESGNLDLKKGLNRRLSSWKKDDDPSPGRLTYGIENFGYPDAIMRKDLVKRVRSGPWNGIRYSGAPELKPNSIFKFKFISNGDEVYYTYQLIDKSVLSRLVLSENSDGVLQRLTWIDKSHDWKLFASVPKDHCDMYGLCGAYGSCDLDDAPACQCLKGFKARSIQAWNSTDWSGGCVHKVPLDCEKGDGFVKYMELKLPDTTHAWANKSMSLKECERECLKNCSCMAYTNSNISGLGSGCVMWFGDLIDIRRFSGGGQDLYIRMAASELEVKDESGKKKKRVILIVGVAVVMVMLLLGLCGGWCIWKTKTRPKDDRPTMSTVVLMLSSESAVLPTPQQPGFFTERCHMKPNSGETSSNQESCVSNDITVTLLQGR
ncbi:hypothetical protein HHK36_002038 [Tetracentron sinense]|uniref:Receptor-like serine/threonine-protein kinase n=1 Tax=Tetracentron sinense TaxID=13715 RepID=A0A834ZUQ3_TETSI|nr:hypothetical protein HHK36_002038 [Tetracentron sinense]